MKVEENTKSKESRIVYHSMQEILFRNQAFLEAYQLGDLLFFFVFFLARDSLVRDIRWRMLTDLKIIAH